MFWTKGSKREAGSVRLDALQGFKSDVEARSGCPPVV